MMQFYKVIINYRGRGNIECVEVVGFATQTDMTTDVFIFILLLF